MATTSHLKVEFGPPRAGWLQGDVRANAAQRSFAVSHTPNDFLRELIESLDACFDTDGQYLAVANEEPGRHVFRFTRGMNRVDVALIAEGREADAVLTFSGPALEVVLPFWRALRRLEQEFAASEWGHPFPATPMANLTRRIEQAR